MEAFNVIQILCMYALPDNAQQWLGFKSTIWMNKSTAFEAVKSQ